MRSEIPQIEVITAIGDADLEDYVSQLLFTQGWSIIFRAFSATSLQEFMSSRSLELRTVIVYTADLPEFSLKLLDELSSPTLTFISLDGISATAHEIMQKVRGQLRIPLVHTGGSKIVSQENSPKIKESARKVIIVTGSSGAPGITLLGCELANELSTSRKVTYVDADFRSIPLDHYLQPQDFTVVSLAVSDKPTQLPDTDSKELLIVDVGVLPSLGEVVNDRRWQAILRNNIFDVATSLVYVCQTTKSSLMQLDQFIKEFPILMKKVAPTYVCISKGGSKELRDAQSAFNRLVSGEKQYQLPESALRPAASGAVNAWLSGGGKGKKEIGSIAASLL